MKRSLSVTTGKGSLNHNDRKFTAQNVDFERTKNNITYRTKIHLYNKDVNSLITRYIPLYGNNSFVYFDPPYFEKGKELYLNFFSYDDHIRIEEYICNYVNCDWVITYDNVPEIEKIYKKYPIKSFDLNYCAGKNRKASEFIIFKEVFDIRLTEGAVKGILAGASASFIGRGVSQVLLGWIPVLGNAINTATAAGITEAIGWMAVAHFFSLQQDDKAKYKFDGMKEGYARASAEYEVKLRRQAQEFIKQQKNFEKEAYEQLIAEYENYICKMEEKFKKTDRGNENDYIMPQTSIDNMKSEYESLVKLKA